LLQDIKLSQGCGVHVHVDGSEFLTDNVDFESALVRLYSNVFVNQEVLFDALAVLPPREVYTKKLSDTRLDKLLLTASLKEVKDAWYKPTKEDTWKARDDRNLFDHSSRQQALNLHSLFQKGTIEFRMFNTPAQLDENVLRAYAELSLGLTVASLNNVKLPPIIEPGKKKRETMDHWLCCLGLCGDEFKRSRGILTNFVRDKVVERNSFLYQAYIEDYEKYAHGEPLALEDEMGDQF